MSNNCKCCIFASTDIWSSNHIDFNCIAVPESIICASIWSSDFANFATLLGTYSSQLQYKLLLLISCIISKLNKSIKISQLRYSNRKRSQQMENLHSTRRCAWAHWRVYSVTNRAFATASIKSIMLLFQSYTDIFLPVWTRASKCISPLKLPSWHHSERVFSHKQNIPLERMGKQLKISNSSHWPTSL